MHSGSAVLSMADGKGSAGSHQSRPSDCAHSGASRAGRPARSRRLLALPVGIVRVNALIEQPSRCAASLLEHQSESQWVRPAVASIVTWTKVGLCGFTMAAARYPHHFGVVEVQQTFYQPPADGVITRWRAQMPASFEFTLKAWMLVTHTAKSPTYRRLRRPLTAREAAGTGNFQPTAIVDEGWRTSLNAAVLLRATAILFQCPASFLPTAQNLQNMRDFFARIEHPAGVRLLFEPRGTAWTPGVVRPLVDELGLVQVVDPFVCRTVSTDVTYFRLHGITGTRHVYTDDELRQLRAMVPATGATYVMFNNIPRVADAARFKALLALPEHPLCADELNRPSATIAPGSAKPSWKVPPTRK
ncbi:MAG TPA: DUF72 domain-containing protein [Kofleriaceae bacterium]|nr:DUF72 domain-containing protein [Kofleriaceae bacterium]